jgi:pre-mRNA-splicing factor RBM22/SLT11
MLDLSFGLPIVVRDAALKMVAPGPQSEVNREYYAQEHEKEIEEGRGGVEAYEKTDEKARELLRRLANSQPYFKKQRRIGLAEGESASALQQGGAGPIRTRDTSGGGVAARGRGGRGGARGGRSFPSAAQLPPTAQDILPPADTTVMSLFVTGVEDDLPEHKIREFFSPYGKLRSLVCSHMSHCAFINYATREGAEAAAEALQGRAVIAGCPLRVQWGRPRPIGTMDKDERIATGREGRSAFSNPGQKAIEGGNGQGGYAQAPPKDDLANMSAVAPPPGSGDVQYASLAGN